MTELSKEECDPTAELPTERCEVEVLGPNESIDDPYEVQYTPGAVRSLTFSGGPITLDAQKVGILVTGLGMALIMLGFLMVNMKHIKEE